MSRKKLSIVRIKAIHRMKELGFTVTSISSLLGISRVTVYDYLDYARYKARLKRSINYRRKVKLIEFGKTSHRKEWEPEV